MQYHKKVLQNGLRVITVPMASFESATVLVMVGAGSRYETRQNSGISHFLEHMAFKGTEKRPSALDISTLIDGIGGEFNAFTGKETTGYYIKSSAGQFELCLDVISDMLQHSKLDQKEIDKEKGVILEEINLYEDMPVRKIGDIYEKLLYGDTPMGWDIAGEKDVIRSLKREDFVDYMGSLYSAGNIVLVVAGGVQTNQVEEAAEKYFGKMQQFDTKSYTKVVEKQEKAQLLLKQKDTEQMHIAIGFRTVSIDSPDRFALSVLSSILGGGMSSRLFHEVREKRGLAYYVRTTSDHFVDAGSLVTTSGLDPKRVEEGVKVIVQEYRKFADEKAGITSSEFKKAKEYLKGHFVLELEDSRSVAGFYSSQELLEKEVLNPDQLLEKIDKVTVEEVEEVAKKYFKNKGLNMAGIGNFASGQNFKELLTLS